uniref:CARD domain-containing protein n=1 Tax=Sander lucioperca TaxID=283035 RepID=A0A8C9Y6V6_SANLU
LLMVQLIKSFIKKKNKQSMLFVDKHRVKLIQRVTNIAPILDGLLLYNVIDRESYDEIISIPDSQEKMRALYRGPLKGVQAKEIFYKILKENEPHLISDIDENVMEKVQVSKSLAI